MDLRSELLSLMTDELKAAYQEKFNELSRSDG